MTIERLIELIEVYGSEPARWPESERAAALAYMDANPADTKAAFAAAAALDQVLDIGKKQVSGTDLLAARILKAAAADTEISPIEAPYVPANDRLIPWRKSTWKSVAATLVITTSFGFAAGQSAVAKSARMETAEALLSLTPENTYDSDELWEDLQ